MSRTDPRTRRHRTVCRRSPGCKHTGRSHRMCTRGRSRRTILSATCYPIRTASRRMDHCCPCRNSDIRCIHWRTRRRSRPRSRCCTCRCTPNRSLVRGMPRTSLRTRRRRSLSPRKSIASRSSKYCLRRRTVLRRMSCRRSTSLPVRPPGPGSRRNRPARTPRRSGFGTRGAAHHLPFGPGCKRRSSGRDARSHGGSVWALRTVHCAGRHCARYAWGAHPPEPNPSADRAAEAGRPAVALLYR